MIVSYVFRYLIFECFLMPYPLRIEAAQIRAAQRVVHETVRADFDAADGFEKLGNGHGKNLLLAESKNCIAPFSPDNP